MLHVWNIMHGCIIPYSTCRGVLTGSFPHSCNTYKCGVWVWPLGQVPVVVSCTTGQYHIYCHGGAFDLRHRWDTSMHAYCRIIFLVMICHKLCACLHWSSWIYSIIMFVLYHLLMFSLYVLMPASLQQWGNPWSGALGLEQFKTSTCHIVKKSAYWSKTWRASDHSCWHIPPVLNTYSHTGMHNELGGTKWVTFPQ